MLDSTTTEPTAVALKCPLLKLPAELLNRIYELVFPHIEHFADAKLGYGMQKPAITRVNRHLRGEALNLYYSQTTMRLDVHDIEDLGDCGAWLKGIDKHYGHIERFEFHNSAACSYGNYFVQPCCISRPIHRTESSLLSLEKVRKIAGWSGVVFGLI